MRVTDELARRWTDSNDSALNKCAADLLDARERIAALKAWQDDVTVAYGSGYGGARFDEVANGVRALRERIAALEACVREGDTIRQSVNEARDAILHSPETDNDTINHFLALFDSCLGVTLDRYDAERAKVTL